MAQSERDIEIAFLSAGLADDAQPLLHGAVGREELSRLFEIRLLLSRATPLSEDELDIMLSSHCAISLGKGEHDVVTGCLERIELLDHTRDVMARYVAVMVPTVRVLELAQTCRVYQDVSALDLIDAVLGAYGLEPGRDFDVRVHAELSKREYVVQYQESDWAFLQRWMEHEGLFYWFEHGAGGEKLVIADDNEDTTPIADPKAISYRERNNLAVDDVDSVWDWQLSQRRVAARVAVLDYNYRTPQVPLLASADIEAERGFGSVFYYGEHFKTPEEGKATAKHRAELHACRRRVFSGRTDCARFRVGHTFDLENHHDAQHDGTYLITSIEHHVGAAVPELDTLEVPPLDTEWHRYRARFTAIPKDVPYRPERCTPWPKITGVMHAHVAGDTSGEHAELDDSGRYRIQLPFDTHGPKGSKVSRWVRMAQPYAGGGYGQHFPLHKGTEVLLAHVDGDPDRPIIVGAVPNPRTVTPTTSANATQSVIQTAAGIRIEMEDNQS